MLNGPWFSRPGAREAPPAPSSDGPPAARFPRPADARVTTVGGGVGLVLSIAAIVLLVLVNPAPGGAAGPASVRSQPSPSSVPAAKMRA